MTAEVQSPEWRSGPRSRGLRKYIYISQMHIYPRYQITSLFRVSIVLRLQYKTIHYKMPEANFFLAINCTLLISMMTSSILLCTIQRNESSLCPVYSLWMYYPHTSHIVAISVIRWALLYYNAFFSSSPFPFLCDSLPTHRTALYQDPTATTLG